METRSHMFMNIRELLGREDTFQASEPVDAGKIRRFAKSLGLEDPRYYGNTEGPPMAPPTFVFAVNHDSTGEMDETGRPTSRISLPPPYGSAIRGGNKYTFFLPVTVGDIITTHRKVIELQEKQGRTGTLVLLTYDLTYSNQRGQLLGINRETLIFRIPFKTGGAE